jgi:4'-phosphopantetheinyl transferase
MTEVMAWSSALQPPELLETEVHVWRASLGLPSYSVERLSTYLSPEESGRAARFVRASDRERFMVARGILRELLGGYLHRPPASLLIETAARGKPSLCIDGARSPLHFNLSHSHGLALYAFALGRELGIDVERIRPEVAQEGIEERYFSAQELRELRALPKEKRSDAFFLCWTRKEAYIKARGEGLYIPLDSFDVSLTPGEPARLNSQDKERWAIYSIPPQAAFAGALVVEGETSNLRFWEWHHSNTNDQHGGKS